MQINHGKIDETKYENWLWLELFINKDNVVCHDCWYIFHAVNIVKSCMVVE